MDVSTIKMDNDTRGWIMTCISGIACVLGAAVICVDLIIRLLPSKRNFRIQDSDGFLSCSLSLSAGVMLFSSLYSMLPNAKKSLQEGGHSASTASWILIACFLGGVFGIQIFSNFCHRFIPHYAVDCDHTHNEPAEHKKHTGRPDDEPQNGVVAHASEQTPLLSRSATTDDTGSPVLNGSTSHVPTPSNQRPPLQARVTTQVSRIVGSVSGQKDNCDADGPCYGWSQPCGQDCFRNINTKGGSRMPSWTTKWSSPRSSQKPSLHDETATLDIEADSASASDSHSHHHNHDSHDHNEHEAPHHHHVPQNAFLSISLQTSIAIALHKLPEGFITYATNHANPTLGVTVFLALFIHNITEGFALALPIFLATQSRVKAMLLTLVLGGLSQPAGAGVAALWLHIAEGSGRGEVDIDAGVYGGMFAVTAGIMASVAVSLLSESFELSHSRGLCMAFCFVGMGVLGCSNALTA